MPRRPTRRIPENIPEEMLDQFAPRLQLAFYPRFLYLLDELAKTWGVEKGNRAETLRRAVDEFSKSPREPIPWYKARPRRPKPGRRVEDPVRPRPYVEEEEPIRRIPFVPNLTYRQLRNLDRWVEEFGSTRTDVLYQAIWDAAIAHGIIPEDESINLRAPENWEAG